MRGWNIKSSDYPYSFRAEKEGFVITSDDAKTFVVTDPDGSEISRCGSSLEAVRLGEAVINRLPPEKRFPRAESLGNN